MVGSLALLMVMQPGSAPGREGHTETTDRTMAVESVGGVAALVGAGSSTEGQGGEGSSDAVRSECAGADGLHVPGADEWSSGSPTVLCVGAPPEDRGEVEQGEAVDDAIWPADEARRVILCESSGRADAENGTNIGLFQINIAAHPYTREQMLDPVQNTLAAIALWRDQGWAPWSCRP